MTLQSLGMLTNEVSDVHHLGCVCCMSGVPSLRIRDHIRSASRRYPYFLYCVGVVVPVCVFCFD